MFGDHTKLKINDCLNPPPLSSFNLRDQANEYVLQYSRFCHYYAKQLGYKTQESSNT